MKKFFQKLKMDVKFARAGEGHKLTDDTRNYIPPVAQSHAGIRTKPMTSSQAQAGAAALARQEERSKQTKVVKPVVMSSRAKTEEQSSKKHSIESEPPHEEHHGEKTTASSMENSIKFHSPFTDEIVAKSNLKNHMRGNLLLRLSESPVEASSLMIQTLTSNQEKKDIAVSTLNRYLDNLIKDPDDEKFKKIRKNNKVFSEKVSPVEGTEEFLESVGFKKTISEDEIFFVIESVDVERIKEAKEILASAEALEFRIYRDAKILIPTGAGVPSLRLPDEFYKLSSSEIKREHEKRVEEVELNQQLRTKAMREAGKVATQCNYTIIRVKFPDERLLQGTFRSIESVETLKDFIRGNINVEWAVFTLMTALGEAIDDDAATLQSYKLVPTAVLNLTWNEEIRREVLREQGIDLALRST